jgi:hypothetical protein
MCTCECVYSTNTRLQVKDAFQLMSDNEKSGLGVTDYNGRLIDSLSTNDLRGLTPGSYSQCTCVQHCVCMHVQ